jgi:hypothetical protein
MRVQSLLRQVIDWALLFRVAQTHGILPLLYGLLNRVGPEGVPEVVWKQLRDQFQQNAPENLFMAGELLKILNLFEGNGIVAIPLKGATLAVAAYGSLALRQFSDLDLLLRKRDIPRARDLLIARGYQPHFPANSDKEARYLESTGQLPLIKGEGLILVELHLELMPRGLSFSLGVSRLGGRLERTELAGHEVRTLTPADLLLILCAHGSKHQWLYLKWVCDVGRLIQTHPGLDWAYVQGQARALGIERMLRLGLSLAKDFLGAGLPEDIRRKVQEDRKVRDLAAGVCRHLCQKDPGLPGGWQNSLFHVRVRERLRDKVRFSLNLALGPAMADWTFLSLPPTFSFLYYLLRPVRLAVRYGIGPWVRNHKPPV